MSKLVTYVIPCYHSEATVGQVVEDIITAVRDDGRFNLEIVLVNDNPPDATWDTIMELCRTHPCVHGYCMTHNFGQHAALIAGYGKAHGDIVVSLDDDGQTPPSESFKLIDALKGNVDLVYASYPENAYASLFRKLGSKVNDISSQAFIGKPKDVYLSSYLATTHEVIQRVIAYKGPYPYVDGLMLQCCTEVRPVPVRHDDRASGSSGYSLGKLLSLWLNGFTSFSVKPLRLSVLLGFVFCIISFLVLVVLVVRKLIMKDAIDAGWSSLMCAITLVGGLIMMMLGMVGEYVGRVFMSLNGSPQYFIRHASDDLLDASPELSRTSEEASPSQGEDSRTGKAGDEKAW